MSLKYPKGEEVYVSYYNKKCELLFILTAKLNSRDWYYLYELSDGQFKKLGKARTPTELEEKYSVHEKMAADCLSDDKDAGKTRKKKERM